MFNNTPLLVKDQFIKIDIVKKHEQVKAFVLWKREDSLQELSTSKSVTSDFTVAQIISSKHFFLYHRYVESYL